MNQELRVAKQVIDDEMAVLVRLRDSLATDFSSAVHLISGRMRATQAKVITTGVGKSGIISRKWAATFSSTGTPAFFMNPVEAAHGDMGALGKDDLLIMLTYSGETEELGFLLNRACELDVPVIVVSAKRESSLSRAATLSLTIPVYEEACPLGLAPTTSTTAMLVLGDALAMALMDQKGFTTRDFAKIHPGGVLGKRIFLKVQDLMHQGANLPTVQPHTPMHEVILVMSRKKLGLAVVVENEILRGLITDGDLRRFLEKRIPIHDTLAVDVMTENPKTIAQDRLAFEGTVMMQNLKITSLVVTCEPNRVVGVLHLHDLLRGKIS